MTIKSLKFITFSVIGLFIVWSVVWAFGWWRVRGEIDNLLVNDARLEVSEFSVRGFPGRYDIHAEDFTFQDRAFAVEMNQAVLNTLLYDRSQYVFSAGDYLSVLVNGVRIDANIGRLQASLKLLDDLATPERLVVHGENLSLLGDINFDIDNVLIASGVVENQIDNPVIGGRFRQSIRLSSSELAGAGEDIDAEWVLQFDKNPVTNEGASLLALEDVMIDAALLDSHLKVAGSLDLLARSGELNVRWEDWQNETALLDFLNIPTLARLAMRAATENNVLEFDLSPVETGLAIFVDNQKIYELPL